MTIFDFLDRQVNGDTEEVEEVETPTLPNAPTEEVGEIETPQGRSFFDIAEEQGAQIPEKTTGVGHHLKQIPRHLARSATRAFETVAGLPKEALELQKSLILRGAENLSGRKLPGLEKALESGSMMLPSYYMASSSDLKDATKALSRDFLDPQNEIEEFADDVISDTVSLLIPTKTKLPFWKTFLKAGAISGSGNLAGKTVERQTGSSEAGQYAKLGTMFFSTLLSPNGIESARKYVGKLYNQAKSAISPKDVIDASKMKKNLDTLRRDILSQRKETALAPSERFVVDEIDNVLGDIKDNTIPIETVWAHKRALNEKLEKVIYESPDKGTKARARKLASQINGDLNEGLKKYGKENPAFGIPFNDAEEAFATMAKTRKVENFFRKNWKYSTGAAGLHTVLHALFGTGLHLNPKVAGTVAGAAAVYRSTAIINEISRSSALRKHYLNAIKAAAQENAVVMNREIAKMEKELKERGW